jgi:hypothetical protein
MHQERDQKQLFHSSEKAKKSMEKNISSYLETLVRETRKPETEVVALAVQTGLRQLWRERILARYLRGEMTRDEAIDAVGIDWVELAERQHKAMLEDLAWAMGA